MKTAIVTGASGNLGKAVVEKFIDEGYSVQGTIRHANGTPYRLTTTQYEETVLDLSDESAATAYVQHIAKKSGSIDVAVLTAGGFATGTIETTSTADIQAQLKLNFETAYNIARPVFIQMLKQQYGRIFLVGSRPGLQAGNNKGVVAYALAKSLLFRLAETMNEEANGTNVVVTMVVPGTIDTPENRQAFPKGDTDKWVTPQAIANAIYFYTTEEASTLREPILKLFNNG